ncbi:hypothetical protein PoB_007463400 [Plakobranchus ocellatus]|uniref:Secreted protein n=1 Tax=Plakobranchus ocellatus TaxID=259542 RepID=A0AAV4DV66_9GAST|nr:hypothetical protein PoB_007463400 [Plakobranchus ocellatus]
MASAPLCTAWLPFAPTAAPSFHYLHDSILYNKINNSALMLLALWELNKTRPYPSRSSQLADQCCYECLRSSLMPIWFCLDFLGYRVSDPPDQRCQSQSAIYSATSRISLQGSWGEEYDAGFVLYHTEVSARPER